MNLPRLAPLTLALLACSACEQQRPAKLANEGIKKVMPSNHTETLALQDGPFGFRMRTRDSWAELPITQIFAGRQVLPSGQPAVIVGLEFKESSRLTRSDFSNDQFPDTGRLEIAFYSKADHDPEIGEMSFSADHPTAEGEDYDILHYRNETHCSLSDIRLEINRMGDRMILLRLAANASPPGGAAHQIDVVMPYYIGPRSPQAIAGDP